MAGASRYKVGSNDLVQLSDARVVWSFDAGTGWNWCQLILHIVSWLSTEP